MGAFYLMVISDNKQDQVVPNPWEDCLYLISNQICYAQSLSHRPMSAYITMFDCLFSTVKCQQAATLE